MTHEHIMSLIDQRSNLSGQLLRERERVDRLLRLIAVMGSPDLQRLAVAALDDGPVDVQGDVTE